MTSFFFVVVLCFLFLRAFRLSTLLKIALAPFRIFSLPVLLNWEAVSSASDGEHRGGRVLYLVTAVLPPASPYIAKHKQRKE